MGGGHKTLAYLSNGLRAQNTGLPVSSRSTSDQFVSKIRWLSSIRQVSSQPLVRSRASGELQTVCHKNTWTAEFREESARSATMYLRPCDTLRFKPYLIQKPRFWCTCPLDRIALAPHTLKNQCSDATDNLLISIRLSQRCSIQRNIHGGKFTC